MYELFVLENKVPVPVATLVQWNTKLTGVSKVVKQTDMRFVFISTVFTGVNKARTGNPLVFETRVWGGYYDGYIRRYSTWNEAENGHSEICKMIKT